MYNIEPVHREKSDVATEWEIYDKVIRTLHPFENPVNFIINFYMEKHQTTQQLETSALIDYAPGNNIE